MLIHDGRAVRCLIYGPVMQPAVSVIIPVFDQAAHLPRALASLSAQTFTDWEVIIVDDGSEPALPRLTIAKGAIRQLRHDTNCGLGAALNTGLAAARASLVAYLPADDVWYRDHLATLVAALQTEPQATLAISGVRHHYNRFADGRIEREPIQLVQALHRLGDERWTERSELTTDDLGAMLWDRLPGPVIETGLVTCEWVDHPAQRHKVIRAPGGLNTYRARYKVADPMRFQSSTGLDIDEPTRFGRYRNAPATPLAKDGLTILLVGELAYNPERVLALAERGHRLLGLWCDTPTWFNAVGPLPFGHVTDLPREGWADAARASGVDVIYALLNWQTVPFARQIQRENPGIPFVWHFKEGPFICLEKGCWEDLVALYEEADGRVYSSAEMQDWFEDGHPHLRGDMPSMVLDGDLPKADVLSEVRSPLLSDSDGEIHTVVPGRPIGLHPETVAELAAHKVHLHFYGEFIHDLVRAWIERTRGLAGRFIHIHPVVHQEGWVAEFSQYDAGWLHFFASRNQGELARADWDDLNLPARMATLGVAGVPLLQRDNSGHIVATQNIVRKLGNGLFFRDMADCARQLHDRKRMADLRHRAWEVREAFTFDARADCLIALLRAAVAYRRLDRAA